MTGPLELRRAWAPGRVNLIGDHTDYTGGLCLPIAIDLGTTVEFTPDPQSRVIEMTSDAFGEPGIVHLDTDEAEGWGRYIRGVASTLPDPCGGVGRVTSNLPVGAGLSSSASLEVALALAFDIRGDVIDISLACQLAEQIATGVRCGLMDQLAITNGKAGHALLLDCSTLAMEHIPVPADADIVVVHCGQQRQLENVAYAARREQCEAAAAIIGPLNLALHGDLGKIEDEVIRRRATHVINENLKVREVAECLATGDLVRTGEIMGESHESLAGDFEVSTPALDELVARLRQTKGIFGARLTGAGFGGCVVAVAQSGSVKVEDLGREAWIVTPSDGATVLT